MALAFRWLLTGLVSLYIVRGTSKALDFISCLRALVLLDQLEWLSLKFFLVNTKTQN
jgi:hypothetical protein